EVERIVQKTLKEFKNKGYFNDIDENKLMSLIVSKVLIELQVNDQLYDEMQGIKQTLDSYIQHSRAVSDDIAEIFLDLHNIYSKLEKFSNIDKREKLFKSEKLTRRIQEAEDYLESKKHFISNDVPIPSSTSSNSNVAYSNNSEEDVISSDIRQADKEVFLTNMLMVKKSDFSVGLNRNKQFYTDAERVLR
ncbi:hypothetical protein KR215_005088, partial [Drosophila sulfurigaster]